MRFSSRPVPASKTKTWGVATTPYGPAVAYFDARPLGSPALLAKSAPALAKWADALARSSSERPYDKKIGLTSSLATPSIEKRDARSWWKHFGHIRKARGMNASTCSANDRIHGLRRARGSNR